MFRPVEVKALPKYKLWVKYMDGTKGEVDLSYLAGKGVFTLWNDYGMFEKVHIAESGEIAWDDKVDLCPDAIYIQVSGKSPEQVFPNLREVSA